MTPLRSTMRILTIADTFFPDMPNGMSRVAWDVARAMAKQGHEVSLLAGDQSASSRTGDLHQETRDGVRVFRYPKPAMSALDPFRVTKQIHDAVAALRLILRQIPCDILHCHSIFTAHAAMTAAPDVPRLQTIHSPAIQELSYNWANNGLIGRVTGLVGKSWLHHLEQRAMVAAARRHALSRFTVAQMQREYPDFAGGYDVIPHWADDKWFRSVKKAEARERLGWPADEPILFTVRQLRQRYGIDTAVEGISPLAKAGKCRFFIGGDGQERGRLQGLINRLGATERVRLMGHITDENLRLGYQAADAFILPTRALECFGLIILEALACGLPVIGTSIGAIPENLAPVLPDWIIPADDPIALRRKVEAFLEGQLSAPPVTRLTEYVSAHFEKSRIVGLYEQLFAEVIRQ